jgi:hypothetical protein
MSYSNKFKQGFIDRVEKKLRDCEIIYNPKTKGIWFINREERYWYLEYKIETNYLWWRYEFFNQLKELFCMSNEVFDEIISEWVENKLNCEVLSTRDRFIAFNYELEDTLNCEVHATGALTDFQGLGLEDTLNCKVHATDYSIDGEAYSVKDTLNCKVLSTSKGDGLKNYLAEETLNCKVLTTNYYDNQLTKGVEDTLNLK